LATLPQLTPYFYNLTYPIHKLLYNLTNTSGIYTYMLTIERVLSDVGDGPERNREKRIISDIVSSKCCPHSEQKSCCLLKENKQNILRGDDDRRQGSAVIEGIVRYHHQGGGQDHTHQTIVIYQNAVE